MARKLFRACQVPASGALLLHPSLKPGPWDLSVTSPNTGVVISTDYVGGTYRHGTGPNSTAVYLALLVIW